MGTVHTVHTWLTHAGKHSDTLSEFKANSMESADAPPQKLTLGIVSNCSLLPIPKAPTGTGTQVLKPMTSKLRVKLTSNLVKNIIS